MITVVLADDHAVVAEGLGALLKEKFTLLRTVYDGRALVAAAIELNPDVVVTDISMPLLNGLDAIRQIKSARPAANIIILTMHIEPDLAVQAFRAGASGYLLKTSAGEELVEAVRQVAQGRAYLTSLIAKDLISVLLEAKKESPAAGERLTGRQREVLQLIAEGRTMKEVASLLHISPRTAESHKYEIMNVLGAQNGAELVQHAIRMKLSEYLKRPMTAPANWESTELLEGQNRVLELIARGAPLPKILDLLLGVIQAQCRLALLDPSAGPRRDSRAARSGAGSSGGIHPQRRR